MSDSTPESDVPTRRVDGILAYAALALFAIAIACFFAIMIGTAAGAHFNQGLWPAVGITVYIAPITAFLLIMVVLISSFVRRARANKAR